MTGIVIFHYGGYRVTSYGNGGAYQLEAGGTSVFVQGDDATDFRREFDAADALSDPDQRIRRKCDICADLVLYT